MIRTIADRETQKIYDGIVSTKLPIDIQNVARRKLKMISAAVVISDLKYHRVIDLRSLRVR